MAKQSAVNLDITVGSDGFTLSGGTTPRSLGITGGNITLTGTGSATLTFPTTSTTIAGLGIAQTFTAEQSFSAGISASGGTFSGLATFSAGISASSATFTGTASFHTPLVIKTMTNPGTAESGSLFLWNQDIGDRKLMSFTDDQNYSNNLQICVGRTKIAWWSAIGNATTAVNVFGIVAPTAAGTATTRTVAITSELASMRRLGYVSATTASSVASLRHTQLQFWRGNAEGLGGFMFAMRFGPSDAANLGTGPYMFCGLRNATGAPTSADPETLTDVIGVAQLIHNTNLFVIHNDASGSGTTIDLGSDFPCNLNTEAYEATFAAPPNGTSVGYQIKRLGTTFEANGTISSNIPANTQLLAFQLWRSNNAKTGSAVGIDISTAYMETLV